MLDEDTSFFAREKYTRNCVGKVLNTRKLLRWMVGGPKYPVCTSYRKVVVIFYL